MLEPVRAEAVLPDRALYFRTFSHFLIVNKSSLSLSLPPSLSPPPSLLAYDLLHFCMMYVVVEYALRTVAWSLFCHHTYMIRKYVVYVVVE